MIVVSVRDVKKDEEICISYVVGLMNLSETMNISLMIRENLRLKWGIVCNPNCHCFNEEYWIKIDIARRIEKDIKSIAESGRYEQADRSTQSMKLMGLEIFPGPGLRGLSVIGLKRTVELGFQILTQEVDSGITLIEFLSNEFGEPISEEDGNERVTTVTRKRPGQPFCAYVFRYIPE